VVTTVPIYISQTLLLDVLLSLFRLDDRDFRMPRFSPNETELNAQYNTTKKSFVQHVNFTHDQGLTYTERILLKYLKI